MCFKNAIVKFPILSCVEKGLKPDLTMVNAAIKTFSLSGAIDEADALAE